MTRANGKPLRVMVVEDSLVVRDLLIYLLGEDPDITVVGALSNGEEAIEAVKKLRPDVITMDMHMPKMNGLDATRVIMETCPTPIVVVSGSVMHDGLFSTFNAFEAGALAVVQKPKGLTHEDYPALAKQLIQTVKLMSEIKVVKRWGKNHLNNNSQPKVALTTLKQEIEIVAIGASTGGPVVLKTLLQAVRKDIAVPILVVQHITPGFTEGFVEWLRSATGFPINIAVNGCLPRAGNVYVAPDEHHMQMDYAGRIALIDGNPINGHRPSVSALFGSIVAHKPERSLGILLTGMGRDGAEELKLMKEKGAITIAQNKETSIVYGMPGVAVAMNAATYVLSPEGIAKVCNELIK